MSTKSHERKLYSILFVSLFASGLILGFGLHAALPPPAVRVPDHDLAGEDIVPGTPVVTRWQDAFWEGTVVAVQGELVAVAWDQPPPELSYRPRSWIARMNVPPAAARAGQWLLCRADRGVWHPCLVESVAGDALEVITAGDARLHTVARADTLSVPAGLVDWATRHGTAAVEQARLAARLQVVEPVTAGKPVSERERVLARWTDSTWWEAEVTGVADSQITVAWADGSAPSALSVAHVAPLSSAPLARQAGEIALCKWGQGTRWWAARIEEGKAGLEIAYIDGTREPLAGQCIAGRTPDR